MNLYTQPHAEDADWIARAALFHGHLGPWLISGAMVGQDAIRRLNTPGHWKINVTCWMPVDRHRTPFTCLLDGLQAACGATMGKRNLWLRDVAETGTTAWPLVHVVRAADQEQPAEGLAYAGTAELLARIGRVTPERLEEDSRALAREDVNRLFRVMPLDLERLVPSQTTPATTTKGHAH